eukprot:76347_1
MQNQNRVLQHFINQNELNAQPFIKPFIRDGNDTLRYLNDCNNYIQQFETDDIPHESLMKKIVNKIPSATRRLYRVWCNTIDDEFQYEMYDMDSLMEYIRASYPLPNTLRHVMNKIEAIVQRWREGPISEHLADADPLTLADFHASINNFAVSRCEAGNPAYKFHVYPNNDFNLLARNPTGNTNNNDQIRPYNNANNNDSIRP